MHDGVFCALNAFKGAADQILAALHEDLDGHVIGDQVVIDQVSAEIKVGLARGRKADLDFFETHFDQRVPHADFAVGAHGFDQGLVAIAQIHAAPDRWLGYNFSGPFAVWQMDGRKSAVFAGRVYHHDLCLVLLDLGDWFIPLQSLDKRPEGPQGLISRSRVMLAINDMMTCVS